MAVTRINNNQISDASAGNAYVGINASTKLQPYSITATKLANNLTYGSDLTVTGNLTVQGNTTAIDTTYTTVEDPILLLASNQTGAPSVDIGFVGQRGTSDNIAFVWDESTDEFITAFTTTGESNTTVSIASYANLHTGNANIGSNLTVNGTTTLIGDVTGNLTVQGNIAAPYFIGDIVGNITGNVDAGGANTQVQFNDNELLNGSSGFTFDKTSNAVVVTGNVSSANLNATANVVSVGVVASGNITGGNLLTSGVVNATGDIVSSANIDGINLNVTTGVYAATGYFTGNVDILGNLNASVGLVYANSGIFYGDAVTGNNAAYFGVPAFTYLGSNIVAQFTGNVNNYSQINFQNVNDGSDASTDLVLTADNGDDASYFVDLGISSSTYNYAGFPAYQPNDAYLLTNGGNLLLNTDTADKVIKFIVGGSANVDVIATLSNTTLSMTGDISATGNITGANLNTAGKVVATGNVQSSANVTGANLVASSAVIATGNITGGNLLTAGLVSATGNITSSGNIAGGNLNITSEIRTATIETTGNILVGGNLTVQGNIQYINVDDLRVEDPIIIMGTGPNGIPLTSPDGMDRGIYMEWYTTGLGNSWIGWENSSGNLIAAADVNFSANNIVNVNDYGTFQAGNIYAQSAVTTSNITGGNLNTGGQVVSTGNVTGGNLITGGFVSATGNVNTPRVINGGTGMYMDAGFPGYIQFFNGNGVTVTVGDAGNINSIGNVNGANITTPGVVDATGNITGGNLITTGLVSVTGNVNAAGATFGGNVTAQNFIGNISGNIDAGGANTQVQFNDNDLLNGTAGFTFDKTSNAVVITGNVTGANLQTAGSVNATGIIVSAANIAGANLIASANLVSAGAEVSGNITGGNLLTSGVVSATGNVSGGNLITPNLVSATTVTATGNVTGANVNTSSLTLNDSTINSTATRITLNSNSSDVDFAVNGDTLANVFYVDAGTGTASFGSATQTTNSIVAFNASNSVLMPVGNTAQRPGTGVTGMLRFNSTLNGIEVFNTTEWATVGTPSFTVISDEQFNGDGVTVAFTLSAPTTTNSTLVSINGIVQIPTLAYSVGGGSSDELTFTEAPQTGDIIDVRIITTTTQVVAISNSPGNAIVAVNPTSAIVDITGDLNPTANITFNLGSPTSRWKDLYLAGNTITLGNVVIKNLVGGNTIAFYGPDGTTPAEIDTGTGPLAVSGIINSGANGVGNIGNSTTYFNTVFAKATSAQYADLAEIYAADAGYEPGTVLSFGGEAEVTITTTASDARIAGVVSTNPSYIMNSTLDSQYTAVVALTGRVPTKVSGPVSKGDMMVSGGNGRAVACATPAMGTVIGKALENHTGEDGVIEVVVGRL